MTFIATNKKELKEVLREVLPEVVEEINRENPEALFSIPQTARKLGKDTRTIQRMIRTEILTATLCGKYVSQEAINTYLRRKPLKTK